MKRLAFTALLASACLMAQPPEGRRGGPMGFGPGPGGPGGPGGPEMRRPVTGAPYSAVEVSTEQQQLAGGNVIQRQTTRNISRDGQGRVRVETQMTRPNASGQPTTYTHISISDPVAGVAYDIDPQNKVANSHPIRPMGPPRNGAAPNGQQANLRGPGGPRAARPADPNVKSEDLGTQSVNSVLAKGSRTTHTIPAGTIGNTLAIQSVRETWISSDLQVPVMEKVTDPRFGTRTTQLTQINRGEPDASLFTVPSDYTVHKGGPGGRGPGRGPRPPANGGGQKN